MPIAPSITAPLMEQSSPQDSTPMPHKYERIFVTGGTPLRGEIEVSGSKNSSLPIIAAALLASRGETVLHNVPDISDANLMCQMLGALGAKVRREGRAVVIDAQNLVTHRAPDGLVRAMRASFYVAAPLLARLRQAEVPLPGGCVLGARPVNYHIDAFTQMGAEIVVEHGAMVAHAPRWEGATIYLEPKNSSVGATVNVMMAACLADGTTTIENAAREPEVQNLADFLNKMGGKVYGAGSSTIVIHGVEELTGAEHSIFNDRIEAGTFLAAAGMVPGGDVTLTGLPPSHLPIYLDKLSAAGMFVQQGEDWIRVARRGPLRATDVSTAPFPGFATDLQPPFVALMLRADGRSAIEENLYDGRFNYLPELMRMGADIDLNDNTALIRGVPKLSGAEVQSTDLRAGATLVLAGLAAEGTTAVSKIHYIDRGYEDFVGKLLSLGALIERRAGKPSASYKDEAIV